MAIKRVIIIGGGPAGMMACARAKKRADEVILIEKNPFLGKKLRITGKGRCNITNSADISDFFDNIPTNPTFLYSALYSFTNEDTINLFNSLGLATKEERGGRIFPQSDSAKDVCEALSNYALSDNVRQVNDKAVKILVKDGRVYGVRTSSAEFLADSVIIATGGKSYPATGSTGDGYSFAKSVGHTIITPKPSLVPIVTHEKWVSSLMGLSLKNVALTLSDEKGTPIYSDFGEMIFTHFGISGPIALSASTHIKDLQGMKISIDLKPALSFEQLDKRIVRDFEKFSKKHLVNSLDELLPKAIIPVIIELAELEPHKPVCSVTREERKGLCSVIKALPLSVKCLRPIEEAIITSGGVKVSEINPSTMQSKLISGLYFAGEVIDVDAYTGGFNLQIAFSTGYLAGENV